MRKARTVGAPRGVGKPADGADFARSGGTWCEDGAMTAAGKFNVANAARSTQFVPRVSSDLRSTEPPRGETTARPNDEAADGSAADPGALADGWLGRTLTPKRRKSLGVLFRFGLSSVGTMAVKVALTWLFAHRLEEHVAYFLTHVLIFFWSYYSHLRFTFNEPHSGRRMWDYFKAVLLLKIADFVLFSAILKVSENELSLSVLIASLVMTSGRFVTVKRALVRRDATVPSADADRS